MKKLSKRLLTVSEKIALGEEIQTLNQRKIIESIESLSDVKLNKGAMSIEKNNLLDKLSELTAKLDELSVKRDGRFNEKDRCDKNIDELDRSVYDLKNQIEEKERNKIVCDIVDYFISLNVKMIVIACNTATTRCISMLRDKYKDMIFVGTEPAVKVACDNNYIYLYTLIYLFIKFFVPFVPLVPVWCQKPVFMRV